jgi:hypothetical protein
VPNLLMLASGVGLVAATAALWVQGWRPADHRFFAGLTSIAVTLSLFSLVAWAATAIAPLPLTLTWVLVGTLALLFALGLYRQLQEPPRANVLLSRAWLKLASIHHSGRRIRDRLQPAENEDEDVGDDADDQHDAGSRSARVKDCVAPTM